MQLVKIKSLRPFLAILILVVSILSVVVFLYFDDDEIKSAVVEFIFSVDLPANKNNAEFAIIGLTAPESVTDIHTYGLQLVSEAEERAKLAIKNNADAFSVYEIPVQDGEIEFRGDSSTLACWEGIPVIQLENIECATKQEVSKMLSDNEILLSRYETILQYENLFPKRYLSINYQQLINLHRLYIAKVHLLYLQNRIIDALDSLDRERNFYSNLLNKSLTWVERAITLVPLNSNIRFTANVIDDSKLAAEISATSYNFRKDLMRSSPFNIKATIQAELALFSGLFYCHKENIYSPICFKTKNTFKLNRTMNMMYESDLKYMNTVSVPPNKLINICKNLKSSNQQLKQETLPEILFNIFNWHGYLFYKDFLTSNNNACEIILVSYDIQAIARLATAYSEIVAGGISGSSIQKYLNDNVVYLGDPYTNDPLVWDQNTNSINLPKNSHAYQEWSVMKLP